MKRLPVQFSCMAAMLVLAFAPNAIAQSTQSMPKGNPPSQRTAGKTNSSSKQRTEAWKKIPIPPLPSFKPAQPNRIQLANGMVIFLQEDHELPLIDLTTMIRGGSRMEPPNKVGLVDMYGDVWRTGGTSKRTGDEMDDFLEGRAAKLETSGSGATTGISFSCLKADFNDVFAMYLELLRDPAFREDKLALAKDQMRTGIARRNDDSDSIAGREAAQLVYGKQSPYGRVPEYATVDAVTREDLIEWHKKYLAPENIILGVVGDFDSKQMELTLRKAFESWPKSLRAELPEIPVPGPKPGYYFVAKEDINQSEIRVVGVGIDRKNPDYFAVTVMNEIFGGGFASRLFSNLRTKRGLAYSVGGGVGSAWDHPGMIVLSMGTKSQTTVEGVQALFSEVDDLLRNPATTAELKRAKDSILNSFIFNFDTPSEVLRERMVYEFFGFPLDFLERYRSGIEKVTAEDVARVARKYVHRDQLAVLVVGNEAEIKPPIDTLGKLTRIDITIPTPGQDGAKTSTSEPGQAPKQTPTASNAEGKQLIAKVVQFLGGEQNLQSIKALRQKVTSVRKTPQGEMPIEVDQSIIYPDRVVGVASLMGMEIRNVVTPSTVFMTTPQGTRDMTGANKEEAQRTVQRDLINIARHANDASYIFVAGGTEKLGATEAEVLDIAGGNMRVRWFVDSKTGSVLQTSGTSLGANGPVERVTEYSNWKQVDGLKLYFQRNIKENGEEVARDTVEEWIVNPQVDPKLLQRPPDNPQP